MLPKRDAFTSALNIKTDTSMISKQARSLASSLASHMGTDKAIKVSQENQWHGVLAALLEMKSPQM